MFWLNHDQSCSCTGTVSHVNVFTALNMPFPVTASLSFDEHFFFGECVFLCVGWRGSCGKIGSQGNPNSKETLLFLTHDTKRCFREVLFWVNETKRDHTTLSYRTTLMTHKSELPVGLQDPDYLSSILGDFLWVVPHQN